MNESELTRLFCKEFERRNGQAICLVGAGPAKVAGKYISQQRGLPDRILSHRYTGNVFTEFKVGANRPTALQEMYLKKFNTCDPYSGCLFIWNSNTYQAGAVLLFPGAPTYAEQNLPMCQNIADIVEAFVETLSTLRKYGKNAH